MPKHSWAPIPASLGAPGLCSALLHQKARPGVWVGSKPNTSITRGLSQEGQRGQPQDTEPHPVPTLEPGHPNQFSPRKGNSSSQLTSCSPHSLQHIPLATSHSRLAPGHRAGHSAAGQSRGQRQLFHLAPEAEWRRRWRHRGGLLGLLG